VNRGPLLLLVASLGVAAGCGGDDSAGSADSANPPAVSASDSETASATSETIEPSGSTPVIDPGDGGNYTVVIEHDDFSSVVDNPFFPLAPGAVWQYDETHADGETQTDTVEVLDQQRTVMGVDTIVVHDVAKDADGTTVEDTYDWYAQDSAGNVWYFGEDTTSYDEGQSSTEGSWEAGVAGALPGIVMLADPTVSDIGYRQEYLAGVAEDMGQVIAGSGSITVPFGTFDDIIRTRDWSPIEPDIVEEKVYASGIGVVHEETLSPADEHEEVVLTSFTPPA